jgi:carbon-monoxide dehydrogenase large subunit
MVSGYSVRIAGLRGEDVVTEVGAARYVGSRVQRVEDPRLLTGAGAYVDDVTLPGLLHACFVRSPFARARVTGIDVTDALAMPGVHAVFTAADLNPGVHEQWHTSMTAASPETPRPPLADDEVRYVGDPVALVLADNRYLAEDACELVVVDYDPLPPVVDYTTAADSTELVHGAHGSNVVGQLSGMPAAMLADDFAAAAHVVSATIYQQATAAVPMETRGMVLNYAAATGELTIWASTQAPHEWRMFCARLLGIPEQRIRVIARDTGGGFGQKVAVQREDMCLMLAALRAPGPVKWIEDRSENLLSAGKSRQEHGEVRMAFDAEGVITAVQIDHVQDCGAYPTPWPVGTAAAVGAIFPGPYRVPKASFSTTCVYTNTAGRSAYRGPWQFESLAREVVLDIAARTMGVDPVELRRRNVLSAEDLPYTNPNRMTYAHITPQETMEQALSMLGYDAFRREQAEARAVGRYLGVGVANYVEPTTPGTGYYATESATIRIEPSGTVNVYVAGGSCGNSVETTVIQLTADALGVDIADVATIQGDTAVTGFAAGTAGSRTGSMTAGAIGETAAILRVRIVAIAAKLLKADTADIVLAGGRATVRGTSDSVSLAEIASTAYFSPQTLPEGVPAGLEASARYTAAAASNWVNATHVCTCEVDVTTGRVRLLRYIVSEDCGPMINPSVVEGQIAGGTVQGIGGVLMEHLSYDPDGNPTATSFLGYLLPTPVEIPVIEYGHVETPGPNPGGYKGVGEGGAIGAPPAVVNAVADALAPFGVTVTRLPLDPASIVALIEQAG